MPSAVIPNPADWLGARPYLSPLKGRAIAYDDGTLSQPPLPRARSPRVAGEGGVREWSDKLSTLRDPPHPAASRPTSPARGEVTEPNAIALPFQGRDWRCGAATEPSTL
jgi:hypothetical protein